MTAPLPHTAMSEDAYFELLDKSIDKYEYWNGFAVPIAGVQPPHTTIEANLMGELFQQLRGKSCRPLGANQAVRLAASRGYVFPDLSIVCGQPEFQLNRGIGCLLNPIAIMEVLSPSTVSVDETNKLFAYTAIRSIREYILVASDSYAVKHFSRSSPDEIWRAQIYGSLEDRIELSSCKCSLTLADIYSGIDLAGDGYFPEYIAL